LDGSPIALLCVHLETGNLTDSRKIETAAMKFRFDGVFESIIMVAMRFRNRKENVY